MPNALIDWVIIRVIISVPVSSVAIGVGFGTRMVINDGDCIRIIIKGRDFVVGHLK